MGREGEICGRMGWGDSPIMITGEVVDVGGINWRASWARFSLCTHSCKISRVFILISRKTFTIAEEEEEEEVEWGSWEWCPPVASVPTGLEEEEGLG